jgi:hypothetical protein
MRFMPISVVGYGLNPVAKKVKRQEREREDEEVRRGTGMGGMAKRRVTRIEVE